VWEVLEEGLGMSEAKEWEGREPVEEGWNVII